VGAMRLRLWAWRFAKQYKIIAKTGLNLQILLVESTWLAARFGVVVLKLVFYRVRGLFGFIDL
jgi:hypothetical protein